MIRTEDRADVKEYLRLLDEKGQAVRKSAAAYTFQEIDRARRYLDMVFEEPGGIQDRIGNLKDGIGKSHAAYAIAAAQEKLDAAKEGAARLDALVEKGVKGSVARLWKGADGALDRPFPFIAAEKELKNIMDCLAGAFTALDIGIGRVEEIEGMACKDGHYLDAADGTLWADGAGEQAWLAVLWPMRSMEKLLISAQDAVCDAACSVDRLRPKASSLIKKHVLVPGFQWEKEKERERAALASGRSQCKTVYVWGKEHMEEQEGRLCVAENATPPKEGGSGKKRESGKTSLRKRLEMAEKKIHEMYETGSLQEQKSRVGEKQR